MNDKKLEKINTGIATVLSAIFPGLGQFYNGKLLKGFIFYILGVILIYGVFFFFSISVSNNLYFIDGPYYNSSIVIAFVYLVIWGYSIFDANDDSKI